MSDELQNPTCDCQPCGCNPCTCLPGQTLSASGHCGCGSND